MHLAATHRTRIALAILSILPFAPGELSASPKDDLKCEHQIDSFRHTFEDLKHPVPQFEHRFFEAAKRVAAIVCQGKQAVPSNEQECLKSTGSTRALYSADLQETGYMERNRSIDIGGNLKARLTYTSDRLKELERQIDTASADSHKNTDIRTVAKTFDELIFDSNFKLGILYERFFMEGVQNHRRCQKLARKESCLQSLGADEINRLADTMLQKPEKYSEYDAKWLQNVATWSRETYLDFNPRIQIETSPTGYDLIVLVSRGKGIENIEKWRTVFSLVKNAVEKVWQGKLSFGKGEPIELRVRVRESNLTPNRVTNNNEAVVISLVDTGGWQSSAMIGGAAIHYDTDILEIPAHPYNETRIAHEMGHILGFGDRYGHAIDPSRCNLVSWARPDDVMTDSPYATIGLRGLELLYHTYVEQEKDLELWKKIGRVINPLSEP